MKLGTQTGSLVNHILSSGAGDVSQIKAGTPATILSWSDRHPGTVFRVFTVGKSTIVEVRDDDYERIDKNGFSESQTYEYKINVKGYKSFWRNRGGAWERVYMNVDTGRWTKSQNGGIFFGRREAYHDFTF